MVRGSQGTRNRTGNDVLWTSAGHRKALKMRATRLSKALSYTCETRRPWRCCSATDFRNCYL